MVKKRRHRDLEFEEALEDLADLEASLFGGKKKKKRFITKKAPRNKRKASDSGYGPTLPASMIQTKPKERDVPLESIKPPTVVTALPKGLIPRNSAGRVTTGITPSRISPALLGKIVEEEERKAKCPVCGKMIAESQLQHHIKIELLDPNWKSNRKDPLTNLLDSSAISDNLNTFRREFKRKFKVPSDPSRQPVWNP